MNKPSSSSRRQFLQRTAATAGTIFAPNILIAADEPKKQLNFAGIGCGGKGASDIATAAEGANIVALCDVDHATLKSAQERYPNAKIFDSFREMFEVMGDKIDGVTISTPDHAHYPAAMEAIKRRKHLCVQKPLVNRIWEANELHQAAKKMGVHTNMGNQGHTKEPIRQLKEWLAAGIVGNVKEIHVWTNRPIWPQGNEAATNYSRTPAEILASYPEFAITKNAAGDTLVNHPMNGHDFRIPRVENPKNKGKVGMHELNWTRWLAAQPDAPFIWGVHDFAWRGSRQFGAGAMGDMGCHIMDGPFWGCDLPEPYKIEAESGELTETAWPQWAHVICYFKHPKFGEIKLHWYEGKKDGQPVKPERPAKLEGNRDWNKMIGGFIIVGDEDSVLNAGDYCEHLEVIGNREKLAKFAKDTPKTLPRSLAPDKPQLELVRAIEAGSECGSHFDYSVPLTKLCLFGNLGMCNPGKVIEWDTATQQIKNGGEANALLRRPGYREGWDYSADKI